MGKVSKNVPSTKHKDVNPIISSVGCINCKEQCDNFKKYELRLKETGIGKGVKCQKLINKNKGLT